MSKKLYSLSNEFNVLFNSEFGYHWKSIARMGSRPSQDYITLRITQVREIGAELWAAKDAGLHRHLMCGLGALVGMME